MKSSQQPDNDEPLHALLREWAVNAPLPSRFQDQVWQRIARADAPPILATLLRSTLLALQRSLSRPKLAFAYVATLFLLGVVAGSVAAQTRSSRLDATLSARYIQSVDPYRAETSQP